MSEAQLRDQVVLEVAVALVTQQHNALLYRFHSHLLSLQDCFHGATRSVRDEFDVCTSIMTPPATNTAASDAAVLSQRMAQLADHYAATAEQEIRHFLDEAFTLQQRFKDDAFRASNDWHAAERRRQDDFTAAMVLARREVTATLHLMKAEQAQTETEVSAMAQLRVALDQALAELNKIRAESELARTKTEMELLGAARRHEADRAEWQASLRAEREAASAQLRELVAEGNASRRQHLAELAEASAKAAETVDAARAEVARIASLQSQAQREADEAHRELANAQKSHSAERLELQKTIAGLEFDLEKMRLLLDAERSETSHSSLELRRSIEARKNAEVEEFKRRLIGSLAPGGSADNRSSASPRSHVATTAAGEYVSSPPSARRDYGSGERGSGSVLSNTRGFSQGPPRDSSAAAVSFSPRSPSYVAYPTTMASSPSAATRSPSDTFVRLQQLSASWKDRLATL